MKASAAPSPRTSTPAVTPPARDLDAQRDELLGLVVAQQRVRRRAPLGVRERARLLLERVDGFGERVEALLADRALTAHLQRVATRHGGEASGGRGQAASVATISSVAPSCSTSRRSEIAAKRRCGGDVVRQHRGREPAHVAQPRGVGDRQPEPAAEALALEACRRSRSRPRRPAGRASSRIQRATPTIASGSSLEHRDLGPVVARSRSP